VRRLYARRKAIVELVFGQIKQGRGFLQFLLRGLRQVRGEWALICTTHNVLKLWTALRRRSRRPAAGAEREPEGRAESPGVAGCQRADRFTEERQLNQPSRAWCSHFNIGQASS